MTARRVVVTGASGFVGLPAVEALIERGFEVDAVGRDPTGLPERVSTHTTDLLDPDPGRISGLLREIRPSHMMHLAWDVTPGRFWHARENLDWVAGTCAEYDWTAGLLDEGGTPIRPVTLYGAAKDRLHRRLADAVVHDGVSMAWARLFFIYGPREAPNRLVPYVTRTLLRGEPALCGPCTGKRDFMHVTDAGGALAATLGSAQAGPVNIATGNCVPIRAAVETLAELIGRPDLLRLGARPAADETACLAASVALLRERVGFTPRFTLAEGLADTVAWWRGRL